MRSRLSLVADRELPEHLIADTEHALTHVGWLGVRRRDDVDSEVHSLRLEGFVPPVTMAHAGHDHTALLADLCRGWVALGVACALLEGDVVDSERDPAIGAVRLLQHLAPGPHGADFRTDLAGRLDTLEAVPHLLDVAGLPPTARALVDAVGSLNHAVHVAGTLLGLRPV